jgi:hypothetical protein
LIVKNNLDFVPFYFFGLFSHIIAPKSRWAHFPRGHRPAAADRNEKRTRRINAAYTSPAQRTPWPDLIGGSSGADNATSPALLCRQSVLFRHI